MGNNSGINSAFFSRHLVEQNVPNFIFGCYILNIPFVIFSILVSGPKHTFLSKKEFREYHGWNRIEIPISKHYTNFQILDFVCEKLPTCFQTLTFCRNQSFQKPWICPWIFQGFPTPWISHPMDFGFSGRPRERPTKTKIGRQGRISRLPEGSRVFFWIVCQKKYYGDSGRFDVTGWSGNILRTEMGLGSPIFSLTES